MFARVLIALLTLFSLLIEITADPTTAFVRSAPKPIVGKLVILDKDAPLPQASSNSSAKDASDAEAKTHNDYTKFNSGSHYAVSASPSPAAFFVSIPVTKLFINVHQGYLEPPLSGLNRPPNA